MSLAHLPRAPQRQAIVIEGAAGGLAIEPLKPDVPAEEQLATRAKRLYKGQRAQLVTLTVLDEIHA